jgi:hypothetical protein
MLYYYWRHESDRVGKNKTVPERNARNWIQIVKAPGC